MKTVLNSLERHFDTIEGAAQELNSPATQDELNAVERELGVDFPDDFRQLYLWHDGEKGDIFLFDSYRMYPLSEVMEVNLAWRKSMRREEKRDADDSGVFKDCTANEKWIAFGDNGGNSILLLDLDPGREGVYGQILESCDGENECEFTGVRTFLADISQRISSGEIAWDEEAGCFQDSTAESVQEIKTLNHKVAVMSAALNHEQLVRLNVGDDAMLVGALIADRRSNRHQLHIKGGTVTVVGELPPLHAGFVGAPPLVQMRVRVGSASRGARDTADYVILSCERVPS